MWDKWHEIEMEGSTVSCLSMLQPGRDKRNIYKTTSLDLANNDTVN